MNISTAKKIWGDFEELNHKKNKNLQKYIVNTFLIFLKLQEIELY